MALCSVPEMCWNGHPRRLHPPLVPWSWSSVVVLGGLTALWCLYPRKSRVFGLFVPAAVIAVGMSCTQNSFIRCRCLSAEGACKANLKNLGTALELYSSDFTGHYPATANTLTPGYLKTIPTCPLGTRYTITLAPAAYTVVCRDPSHCLRYSSEEGLSEPK